MDVIVPGIGEIIGGSQREERYDRLLNRIREMKLNEKEYWWYLELRKYGTVPHAGFGLGFDRAMMLINDYLIKKEKKRALDAAERKHEYTEQTFSTSIEKAAPIPVGVFIPKEFSEAYQ